MSFPSSKDRDVLVHIDSDDSPSTSKSDFNFQSFPTHQDKHQTPYLSTTDPTPVQNENISDNDNKTSFWSMEYFQKFFDVDTDTVVNRIKGSIYPKYGDNYLQTYIQSKPDLYGPFWICVTLIFTIAISGNIANYLQAAATHKHYWKYDFHAVSTSATAIFSYAWIVPALVWGYLKYQNDAEVVNLSILELLCLYGYSLSIYIPIAILWVIQVGFLQVLLVLVGAVVSGYILITSLVPAFRQPNVVPLVVLSGLHFLLALGLMLYFFHVPAMPVEDVIKISSSTTKAVVHQIVTNASNITR